ncbi:MAG TPA: hypothetical protein VMT50_04540 [Steroidobacteraceae bacterium]|nr:hypothetical protein [Steroidobacteraceae bacterium]
MTVELSGKTAVITGSTAGIGSVIAHGLAQAEAVFVVNGRVYWPTHATNAPGRALYDKVAEHPGMVVATHELQSPPAVIPLVTW